MSRVRENRMHGSMWRREETGNQSRQHVPHGTRRLPPTLQRWLPSATRSHAYERTSGEPWVPRRVEVVRGSYDWAMTAFGARSCSVVLRSPRVVAISSLSTRARNVSTSL